MAQPKILVVTKYAPGGLGLEPYYAGEWRDGFELSIALARAGCWVEMAMPAILPLHRDTVLAEILPLAERENIWLRFGRFPMNGHVPAAVTLAHTANWLNVYRTLRPHLIIFMQARLDPGLLLPGVKRRALVSVCEIKSSSPQLSPHLHLAPERGNLLELSPPVSWPWRIIDKTASLALKVTSRLLDRHDICSNYKSVGLLLPMDIDQASFFPKNLVIEMHKGVLADIPQTIPPSQKRLDIVFCGNVRTGKGIFDLMEAMRSLPPTVRLGIIGTGTEEDLQRLQTLARPVENVRIMGAVGFLEKYKWLQAARLFVLPSYSDFYPSAILEALACGLPVITTNRIPTPIVDGYNGLLVDVGRPDQLAAALNAALSDEVLYRKLAHGVSETIRELSWDKAVQNIMRLLPEDFGYH